MALAADLARRTESIGREIANRFVVTIQSRRDQRQEFGGGFLSLTFVRNPGKLLLGQLASGQIGQQACGAPGKMFGMEPGGGPAVRTGPDFHSTEVPKRCVHIFTNLLGGAQKMADDRMNTGDRATHPRFRHVAHFLHLTKPCQGWGKSPGSFRGFTGGATTTVNVSLAIWKQGNAATAERRHLCS